MLLSWKPVNEFCRQHFHPYIIACIRSVLFYVCPFTCSVLCNYLCLSSNFLSLPHLLPPFIATTKTCYLQDRRTWLIKIVSNISMLKKDVIWWRTYGSICEMLNAAREESCPSQRSSDIPIHWNELRFTWPGFACENIHMKMTPKDVRNGWEEDSMQRGVEKERRLGMEMKRVRRKEGRINEWINEWMSEWIPINLLDAAANCNHWLRRENISLISLRWV